VLEANLGEAACVTRAHDNNGRAASAGLTTADDARGRVGRSGARRIWRHDGAAQPSTQIEDDE
jgi:hypothetical protein